MKEIWTDINGYEGLYQISNHGRVKSIQRAICAGAHGGVRYTKPIIKKPTNNGYGYWIISLNRNGKRKNYYIHRLVAEAFCRNPNGYPVVNHKDFDKEIIILIIWNGVRRKKM